MKIFWRFIKPYKKTFLVLMFFLALQSGTEVLIPTLLANMINNGISSGSNMIIVKLALFMVLIAVVALSCAIFAGFIASRMSTGIGRDIRKQVFYNVQEFSLHEVDKVSTSSLITRTTNDVTQVQMFLTFLMRMGILTPLMALSGIIMAIYTGGSLSFILIVTVPLMIFAILILLKYATGYFKSMQGKIDNINRVLRENIIGMKVIRAFKKTKYEVNRFDVVNNDYAATSIIAQRLMGTLMPIVIVIMNLTTIGIVFFGSKMVMAGTFPVGNLVAYIQYITMILMSVMMVSMLFIMYPRANVSANRIVEIIDTISTIRDPIEPKFTNIKSGIEFRNVSFSYPDAEEPVISNITFTVKNGEITALIGSTGSGKSTIANLIPRFYDVSEGELLIDGINVKDYAQKVLRDKIGYVPQKGVLFTGTISDNISFGVNDSNKDDIVHAADISQSAGFIEDKEYSYDEYISQGGTNVSGGQKQRLAIARAVMKDPEIYIFDDSFSALDFKTDSLVRKALHEETNDKTVLIIAQRVSTIMHAENIVVIDQGRIVGTGSHMELYHNCEVYREIVNSQFKKEEIAEWQNNKA